MDKDKFEEVINELEFERNQWLDFSEIDTILLKNGRGIYPDWRHMRFMINNKNEILIKHGSSKPYGARMTSRYNVAVGGTSLQVAAQDFIPSTEYYDKFRMPKPGDIFRMTYAGKEISQAVITEVDGGSNCVIIDLGSPINMQYHGMISYFDPVEYDKETCMHSDPIEGVYMKFSENSSKKGFQEVIKLKNIDAIILNVCSKRFKKKFSVR